MLSYNSRLGKPKMKKNLARKTLQAALCLICLILVWDYASGLEETEFSGGRVTGPLLDMKDIGTLVFVPALLLTFFFRRMAAAITVMACVLCLPLYLYFAAPGPFRRIVGGEWSVPLRANFIWDRWAVSGIVALAMTAFVALWSLPIKERLQSEIGDHASDPHPSAQSRS